MADGLRKTMRNLWAEIQTLDLLTTEEKQWLHNRNFQYLLRCKFPHSWSEMIKTAECSKVKMSSVALNVLKGHEYMAFTLTGLIRSHFNGKWVRSIMTLDRKWPLARE
jgi:hypothetical protein